MGKELRKIKIDSPNKINKKIFYTALYHTMIAPSVFDDVDGRYRGSNDRIYVANDFTNYTTFSLWSTYRAAMPLMTLLHPEKIDDIINTMLNIYRQQGKLPVWHLMGNETNHKAGNPGIIPVADAINKGFSGFDYELAYRAMKNSALKEDRGQYLREKYRHIPCERYAQAMEYDIEYAIADNALAQIAQKFGKRVDYEHFSRRSKSYRSYFDFKTEYIRQNSPLTGNAGRAKWLVPYDLEDLIICFESKEKLLKNLDGIFLVNPSDRESEIADTNGFIGQYAHEDETSHHIIYYYTMLGKPWQTAEKVRAVLATLYTDKADGISESEDMGQISAWYILSSLGIYQVNPSDGKYYFGSPIFEKATIKIGKNKFKITASNVSSENKYIQGVKLNGKIYNKNYIEYKTMAEGGKLEFNMGAEKALWY